ncbi:MAG: hypothetical protein GON13_01655 [Nanoarchaeota archaeon]|nr:hypothetical protein [Nanoarchaeota archaeon]
MEEQFQIIVDNRELKSGVVKTLFEKDFRIIPEQLEVGDYILTDKICCERKSVNDFVNSILDNRLFKQAHNLLQNYEKPFIIIEGSENIYAVRNIHPNAIRGAMLSITLDMKIPIIFTKNHHDTASMFETILKRERKQKQLVSLRGERKPLTDKELMEFIITSLPHVGRKTAQNLLNHFKTVKKIINSSPEELINVEGVGKIMSERFQNIINKKYE